MILMRHVSADTQEATPPFTITVMGLLLIRTRCFNIKTQQHPWHKYLTL